MNGSDEEERLATRRVLVVEDDPLVRRTLARHLEREGCSVQQAGDGEAAEAVLDQFRADLIITDLEMPKADGRSVVALGRKRRVPVVVLTGHADVETAVEMMRAGAVNFLLKPFSADSIRAVLEDAFGRRAVLAASTRGTTGQPGNAPVIGRSLEFQRVLDVVSTVAETDATVLVTGESGTGKEVVARLLHAGSPRADRPFVAVNCGALPDALLESELFGHARGAFTGATHARLGRFQHAEGGTLFLDEVGDMPLTFQVKLLRVLQERQFQVLGESVSRPVNVRIVAATHRDLAKMVGEGTFREDLFYRLNVIELCLPPLRERSEDIPILIDQFIGVANERHGRKVTGASSELVERLRAHRWPGNVRELANVVERMVVLEREGELTMEHLPSSLLRSQAAGRGPGASGAVAGSLPEAGLDLRQAVTEFESSLIDQALARTGGNRNAAAQLLGLNRTTLVEKLRRMPEKE